MIDLEAAQKMSIKTTLLWPKTKIAGNVTGSFLENTDQNLSKYFDIL